MHIFAVTTNRQTVAQSGCNRAHSESRSDSRGVGPRGKESGWSFPKALLSSKVMTNHIWLFKFKLSTIKENEKFIFSGRPATFQVHNSHVWLMATILDSRERMFPSLQKVPRQHLKHFNLIKKSLVATII